MSDSTMRMLFPEEKRAVSQILDSWTAQPSLDAFDTRVINFLNALSRRIFKDKALAREPSFAALAMWLREAQIRGMIAPFVTLAPGRRREEVQARPLGSVFHLCPGNVETMALYSLVVSLLSGNRNLVRISSQSSALLRDNLIGIMRDVGSHEEHREVADHAMIVEYDRNEGLNREFCSVAQARMIWGGDATVQEFLAYPSPVGCRDFVFRDRISVSVMGVDFYLELDDGGRRILHEAMSKDIFPFGQKACSAPHTLFLLGREGRSGEVASLLESGLREMALEFDSALKNEKADTRELAGTTVQKFDQLAIDALLNRTSYPLNTFDSSFILARLEKGARAGLSCGGGFLYLQQVTDLSALSRVLGPDIQTLTYGGPDPVQVLAALGPENRVDRIVPFGQALVFHPIWDGYDLLNELNRKVHVPRSGRLEQD